MWYSLNQIECGLPLYLKVDLLDSKNNVIQNNETHGDLGYRILITNHVKLWSKEFSRRNFIKMMLSSNPDVETDDDQRFLYTGLRMLRDPKLVDKKKFTETADGGLQVELLWLGPIVWKVTFDLSRCDTEDFFIHITQPLLLVLKDQIESESKLRSQLIKKDQEIQGFLEMLPENSPLMRCLRTKKYNDQEHRTNHSAAVKLFGPNLEVVCPPQIIQYRRTSPVIKSEDKCEEDESLNQIQPGPVTAMKMEPTSNIDSRTNSSSNIQRTTLKSETKNCKSEVKIEPTTSGLMNCKSEVKFEPSEGTSALMGIKIEPDSEPHSTTLSSANNNQNIVQTNSEFETSMKVENLDLLVEHDEAQLQQRSTTLAVSPDIRHSQGSQITPRKRRKNLNF